MFHLKTTSLFASEILALKKKLTVFHWENLCVSLGKTAVFFHREISPGVDTRRGARSTAALMLFNFRRAWNVVVLIDSKNLGKVVKWWVNMYIYLYI